MTDQQPLSLTPRVGRGCISRMVQKKGPGTLPGSRPIQSLWTCRQHNDQKKRLLEKNPKLRNGITGPQIETMLHDAILFGSRALLERRLRRRTESENVIRNTLRRYDFKKAAMRPAGGGY